MNGVDGGETEEGTTQDNGVVGSTSDGPDDGPDFANMNGGSEVTAAASSSETASVTGRAVLCYNRVYVWTQNFRTPNDVGLMRLDSLLDAALSVMTCNCRQQCRGNFHFMGVNQL